MKLKGLQRDKERLTGKTEEMESELGKLRNELVTV
jgi:hypothetical protein